MLTLALTESLLLLSSELVDADQFDVREGPAVRPDADMVMVLV